MRGRMQVVFPVEAASDSQTPSDGQKTRASSTTDAGVALRYPALFRCPQAPDRSSLAAFLTVRKL